MLILAIETALKSGSLSLLQDDLILSSSILPEEISMSQNLVSEIDRLFVHNNLDKSDLNLIAVSNGPGSLTGIRVGISVALGLSTALAIECFGVSLLEAYSLLRESKSAIALVPSGNRKCYWQFFNDVEKSSVGLIENEEINNLLTDYSENFCIVHPSLKGFINSEIKKNIFSPQNASELIGHCIFLKTRQGYQKILTSPNPLYLEENLFRKN